MWPRGYIFLSNNNLKLLIRTHKVEKPHQCSQCDKAFPVFCVLHVMMHIGEKPFQCNQCDECDKYLLCNSHLKSQIRKHTEEKPHQCHQWGKTFSWIKDLKSHKRKHTKEKPYHCGQGDIFFYKIIISNYL